MLDAVFDDFRKLLFQQIPLPECFGTIPEDLGAAGSDGGKIAGEFQKFHAPGVEQFVILVHDQLSYDKLFHDSKNPPGA